MIGRLLSLGLLVGTLALASVGCSSEEATEPTPGGDATIAVGASDTSKKDLGVTEWQVTPGEAGSMNVVGLDGTGAKRAEVAITVEPHGDDGATFTYAVKAPEVFTLRYELGKDRQSSNAGDAEKTPLARAVIAHVGEDLKDIDKAGSEQSLVSQSLSPRAGDGLVTPGQDTAKTGQDTGKRGQETTKHGGTCLLDSDGKACMSKLVNAGAAIVGFGACLIMAGVTWGAAAGCGVPAAWALTGAVLDMKESGCKPRSCGDAKTS